MVDTDKLYNVDDKGNKAAKKVEISNKLEDVQHYSFSGDRSNQVETAKTTIGIPSGIEFEKKTTSPDIYYTRMMLGQELHYSLYAKNTGISQRDDVGKVKDTLTSIHCIHADDLGKMFYDNQWGDALKVTISPATLCKPVSGKATTTDGSEKTINGEIAADANRYSGCETEDRNEITNNATLVVTKGSLEIRDAGAGLDGNYTFSNGEELVRLLEEKGFIITYDVVYDVEWDIPEDKAIYAGQTWEFPVLSTIKNTLEMLKHDNPGSYYTNSGISSNIAYVYNRDDRQMGSSRAYYSGFSQFTWNRELFLYKGASVNGETISKGSTINASQGDVVDYSLRFENKYGKYDVLPLVDHMSGPQVLMVSKEENPSLAESGLPCFTPEGEKKEYYLVNKPGEYKNLTIEGIKADSVIVTAIAGGGLDTIIKWYFPDQGRGDRQIRYKAKLSASDAGYKLDGNTTSFSMNNEAWLGDHETHRLYASLPGNVSIAHFDKWIQVEDEPLALKRHTIVHEGDPVKYRINIRNVSDTDMTVGGRQIYDELPTNGGTFSWTKELIHSISYENAEVSYGNGKATDGNEWDISRILPGTLIDADASQDYIVWDESFKMKIKAGETASIIVFLNFPGDGSDGQWDNYLRKNKGNNVFNTFYLDNGASTVSHELAGQTKGVLRKGVYETLLYTNYNQVVRRHSRTTYANGKTKKWEDGRPHSLDIYYTTVYNSGDVRMYLSDLQDKLPKGFHFAGLTTWDEVYSYEDEGAMMKTNVMSELDTEYYYYMRNSERGKVFSTVEDEDASYMNLHVCAEVKEGEQDIITFHLSAPAKSTDFDAHYDSDEDRFYLEPGEALRIGYRCTIEDEAHTDSYATNQVVMPYYDHYGIVSNPVDVDSPELVKVTPDTDVTNNDGGCSLIDNANAESEGFEGGNATTQWFSSEVTQKRQEISPGIQKTIGGISHLNLKDTSNGIGKKYGDTYTGAIRTDDVVNWKVKVFNESEDSEAGNAMRDYSIIDTVDSPYGFIGSISYALFDKNGKQILINNNSNYIDLFNITGRSIGSNELTINNKSYTIGEMPQTITMKDGNSLEFSKEDGKEKIKLNCNSTGLIIPEGCYMEFKISTYYNSTATVLSDQFYNDVKLQTDQSYQPEYVSNGSVHYDGDGNPDYIQSGATVAVAIGYSTSAVKAITEVDRPSNTARSDNESKNYIVIDDPDNDFWYDLSVNTPDEDYAPIKRLVLCDALPEPGDHAAFDAREKRGSQFKVSLTENPEFKISVIGNKGKGTETVIPEDKYKIYLSEKTEFDRADWTAAENLEGWTEYTPDVDASQYRSIRVVINDPGDDSKTITSEKYTLMPAKSQIKIRMKADIDDENAAPGQYGWNSFGYSCTVPTQAGDLTLDATPLKVGVRYPQFPRIAKTLQDSDGGFIEAPVDLKFTFLLYTGSKIENLTGGSGTYDRETSDTLNGYIADMLSEREVTVVQLTVPKGQNEAVSQQLENLKCYRWSSEEKKWIETDKDWVWTKGTSYNVLELPDSTGISQFYSIGSSTTNSRSIVQNTGASVRIGAINRVVQIPTEPLPSTGGSGTAMYYIAGLLILMAAGGSFHAQRRLSLMRNGR